MILFKIRRSQSLLEGVVEHPEWTLIYVENIREGIYKTYSVPTLKFTFTFQRRPEFFQFTFINPTILICIMALFSFCLPNGCGEKITFSITIFLALVVNLMVISTYIPNSKHGFPILGQLFFVGMLIIGVSVLQSVTVLIIHHSAIQPLPVPTVSKSYVYAFLTFIYGNIKYLLYGTWNKSQREFYD